MSNPEGTPPPPPQPQRTGRGSSVLRDLFPVIEGRRKRNLNQESTPEADLPAQTEQRKRRTEKEVDILIKEPRIVIHFDGACRGNGRSTTQSATGVFVRTYNSKYSRGKKSKTTTNNGAEIEACGEALQATKNIVTDMAEEGLEEHIKCVSFNLKGDSIHVIDTIVSGRVWSYKSSARLPNSTLWVHIQTTLQWLHDHDIVVNFEWVPRRLNKEADELANAAIEERKPNEAINSDACITGTLEEAINALAEQLTTRRRRTIRSLPPELHRAWSSVVQTLLTVNVSDRTKRILILIAPHILSAYQSSVNNRSFYKKIRSHISLLAGQQHYLLAVIKDIIGETPAEQNVTYSLDTTKRIAALAALGLHNKIIRDETTYIPQMDGTEGQAVMKRLQAMFPTADLPECLPEVPHIQVEWSDIVGAMWKLKKGKAVGSSGWNRETLNCLISPNIKAAQKRMICDIFETWTNAKGSEVETELLTACSLIPLQYHDRADKTRPITIPEVISKICWIAMLTRTTHRDQHIKGYGSSFARPDGSALALRTIQRAVDLEETVLVADGENTFNLIKRACAFQYVHSCGNIYYDLFPLINMFYARASRSHIYDRHGKAIFTITQTTGTGQGLISGPIFLQWAMTPVIRKHKNVVSVCDDISIVRNAFSTYQQVFQDFAEIGMNLTGPKMQILSKNKHLLVPKELAKVTRPEKAAALLGGVVIIDTQNTTKSDVVKLLRPKLFHKIQQIDNLPTTAFIKFQVLRVIQWSAVYIMSTLPDLPVAHELLDEIEDKINNVCSKIIELPNPHVLYQAPLEDGGLGLLPFRDIHKYIQEDMKSRTAILCREVGLVVNTTKPPNENRSSVMRAAWKHISNAHGWHRTNANPSQQHKSWLTVNPHAQYTSPCDQYFVIAMQHRLGIIQPFQHKCTLEPFPELSMLTPEEVCKHVDSCLACGAPAFHLRHESVVQCIGRTLKHLGVICDTNPKDLPLPGKRKGGPDFMIWTGEPPYAGDVCITSNRTSDIFNSKSRKYDEFCNINQAKCFPMAMSHTGVIDNSSLEILSQVANIHHEPRIFDYISKYVQFACITGQAAGIVRLKARTPLHLLSEPEETTQTQDTAT